MIGSLQIGVVFASCDLTHLEEPLQLEDGGVERVELVLREAGAHQELLEEVLVRQVGLQHQRDQLGRRHQVGPQLAQVGHARVGEDLLGGGDGLGHLGLHAVQVLDGRAARQVQRVEEPQRQLQQVGGEGGGAAVRVRRVVGPLQRPELASAV